MQRGSVALLLAVLACASTAYANAAQSSWSGDLAAEPNGLKSVAIEHEDLAFDLRSLDPGSWGPHSVPVSATYRIVNHGAEVTVPLVFASGSVIQDAFRVMFDRAVVPSMRITAEQAATLPPAWSAPLTTPGLDGGEPTPYYGGGNRHRVLDENGSAAFTITIPPGAHELAVTYGADVDWGYRGGTGTIVYQLGYVLAPAREWESFGTLDVTIDVPPGWRVATSPALERSGDKLVGHFAKLPADSIGISTQAPVPVLWHVVQYALPILFVLVLFGGGFALYRVGKARGEKLVVSDAYGLLTLVWATAIALAGSAVAYRATFVVPSTQTAARGYGIGFGVAGSVLLALIALPIGWFVVRSGRQSMLPKPPPSPVDDVERWR